MGAVGEPSQGPAEVDSLGLEAEGQRGWLLRHAPRRVVTQVHVVLSREEIIEREEIIVGIEAQQ